MASPIDVNLEPVTFQQVAPNVYSNYIVNPYDINGNVIGSQILEVTTGLSQQDVTLPLISSLEPSNYELTLVNVDGNQSIFIYASGSDKIGGFNIPYKMAYGTLTLSVATNGMWTFQKIGTKIG